MRNGNPICGRFLRAVALGGLVMGTLACQEVPDAIVREPSRLVRLNVSLDFGFPTRTVGGPVVEGDPQSWSIFVYRDGVFYDSAKGSGGGRATLTVGEGSYTVAAVVNRDLKDGYSTLDELRGSMLSLADMMTDAEHCVMYGERTEAINEATQSLVVPVNRRLSRVRVKSIRADYSGTPALATKTLTLKRIYLSNAVVSTNMDCSTRQVQWMNLLGVVDSDCPAYLCDAVDTPLWADGSAGTPEGEHTFYACPNPVPTTEDQRTEGVFTPRCTRLVIEGSLDGETRYWTITLPGNADYTYLLPNHSYEVEEVVITNGGSTSPEVEDNPIVFVVKVKRWEDHMLDVTWD